MKTKRKVGKGQLTALMDNQRGQTAVEYMLLMVVIASIMGGVFGKVKTYFIGTGRCPNNSFICRVIEINSGPDMFDGTYRFFTLSR